MSKPNVKKCYCPSLSLLKSIWEKVKGRISGKVHPSAVASSPSGDSTTYEYSVTYDHLRTVLCEAGTGPVKEAETTVESSDTVCDALIIDLEFTKSIALINTECFPVGPLAMEVVTSLAVILVDECIAKARQRISLLG